MRRDKIYEDLNFTTEFSVEDWNALVKLKLGKYFISEALLEKNKEILRTEIVNYIRFCEKPDYLKLFNWTYNLLKKSINQDKNQTVKIFANLFDEMLNTDMKWMSNVLTQPDTSTFSERDKISYYFKIIDETLEGVFKPRLKLLDKLAHFTSNQTIIDNSSFDFGRIIRDFPNELKEDTKLYLEDPFFSISTNQWRNIAAHKSYSINKDNIVIEFGQRNIQKLTISIQDFYKVVYWTQDIYRVIRFAQVITDLNYIEEIVTELGGTQNISVRFESSLLHLIHNLQIVGFEFISTDEQSDTFCLNVKGINGYELQSSLIHSSQCLDQLSCAIYDDKFVRDNFKKTQIRVIDEKLNKFASATIPIEVVIKKVTGEISLEKYLDNIVFEIKNYA